MSPRETRVIADNESGLYLSTAAHNIIRLIVLLVAVVLFVFTLDSDWAYRPEFRLTVILIAGLFLFLIGPRSEAIFINDERVVKITKKFLFFSRSKEYSMRALSLKIEGKTCDLVNKQDQKKVYSCRIDRDLVTRIESLLSGS